MNIVPLTYTICNWNEFAGIFNVVKENATQGVQERSDFGKIAKTISKLLNTKKLDFSLFHLTLGVECDRKLVNCIYDLQTIRITTLTSDETVISIMNASIQAWKQACIECCLETKPKVLRYFFNKVFLLLEQGAEESVVDLHKVMLPDQTFVFKQRY